MSQNNAADYGITLPKAQPGQLYDITDNTVDSITATAATPFGAPIAQGASDELGKVLDTVATDKFLGVALHTHARENDGVLAGYKAKDRMSVLRKGRVWVTVSTAFAKNATVYVTAAGAYTNVVGTNVAIGTFMTSGGIGDLGVIELNRAL